MKLGDICKIWNGKSPINDSKNWLIGIIIKKQKNVNWDEPKYQIFWNDDDMDTTWYEESDIRLNK